MYVKVPVEVKSTNKTPLFSTASKSREKEGGSDTVRIKKARMRKIKCERSMK